MYVYFPERCELPKLANISTVASWNCVWCGPRGSVCQRVFQEFGKTAPLIEITRGCFISTPYTHSLLPLFLPPFPLVTSRMKPIGQVCVHNRMAKLGTLKRHVIAPFPRPLVMFTHILIFLVGSFSDVVSGLWDIYFYSAFSFYLANVCNNMWSAAPSIFRGREGNFHILWFWSFYFAVCASWRTHKNRRTFEVSPIMDM